MPSSAVRTFTDPEDYAAAIRQGTYELTVTQCGDFTARLTRIDLHRSGPNLDQACSRAAQKCCRPTS